ncbi:glutathione S-transferase family protein [Govanella unica]|uniref:Glutathione S-transferase family protein n=1 Tax=Govanella unica TaxID=2975056 RepID=A0A9X3TY32_9PROT|nr:glutathione S-transferase family protein [Govania unica]MDA5193873.1 glutathione S-transferase family protein [Govania unica]
MAADIRLIAVPTSPFAARVKIQAYEKGLDLEITDPPGGFGSEQLYALNPFGKIPILMIGDQALVESSAIQEYLEDIHPTPSLRGRDALETARIRAFIRAVDLYLFPLLFTLRGMGASADASARAAVIKDLKQVVARLAELCGDKGYVCGEQLSLADCALAPAYFYTKLFLTAQGAQNPFADHKVFCDWWEKAGGEKSVMRGFDELREAVARKA